MSRRASLIVAVLALAACPAEPPADKPPPTEPGTTEPGTTEPTPTEPSDLWSWCPPPESATVDPTWEGVANVRETALYCVTPRDDWSLEQALAQKAQVRVVPGAYAVPLSEGSHTLGLPACARFEDGSGVATDAPGAVTVDLYGFGDDDLARLAWSQPLDAETTGTWSLAFEVGHATPSGSSFGPFSIDGEPKDPYTGLGFAVSLTSSSASMPVELTTCGSDSWTPAVHTVTFDGGFVELQLQIGDSVAGTEPSAFVRAAGELDGAAFDQRDYWKLVYQPEHHHFARHFAVVFDAPIGEACGLRIEGLEAGGGSAEPTVELADCALVPVESRAVSADVHTGR